MVDTKQVIVPVAYGTLWLATLLGMLRSKDGVPALPSLLLLAMYAAYALKYALKYAGSDSSSESMSKVAQALRVAYYGVCVAWPTPVLHWYDALALAALFVDTTDLSTADLTSGNPLLALYYALSAASYAHASPSAGHALQVGGRAALALVATRAIFESA